MGYLTQANIGGSDYTIASGMYGTCATAAGTAAKTVTLAAFDDFETGVTIHVKFTYSNTASNATLNVNSKGAKNLCRYGTTRVGTTERSSWKAGAVVSFTYDGTSWVMNDYIEDTGITSYDNNKTAQTGITATGDYPILLKNAANTTDETNGVNYVKTSNKLVTVDPSVGGINAKRFNGIWIGSNGAGTITFENPEGGYINFNDVLSSGGVSTLSIQGADSGVIITAHSSKNLDEASEKGVDTSIASGSTSTNLPTTAAVRAYVDSVAGAAAAGALVYQGTLGATTGSTASLPTSHNQGWYYVVADAGTYAGQYCEAGDMIICNHTRTTANDSDWDVVQSNITALTTAEIDALWAA